ncbi:MAG: 4a-hydroxytetrahydrobiopterin dehydratase [Armatimonadetes bacterium]|nr:4a-hydroxytetrahydrobiopterin dehydratase [Armatimonadota bacterium]
MELAYVLLSPEQVAEGLSSLPSWSVKEGMLSKTFEFESYLKGVDFAAKVGYAAEDLDHHPDITITWRKVAIRMNTHAVNGLSPYDFELASRIEALL